MTNLEFQKILIQKDINATIDQVDELIRYRDFILTKNKEINLTSITDPEEFLIKMTLDSALIFPLLDYSNKKIVDVGTGGGFPGTVISILANTDVDLLDSTKKKLSVINEFGNSKFSTICARAEDYSKSNRETYDIVTARAVSSLSILLELCIPLLKVGGYFVAMKSVGYEDEINLGSKAMNKLNCHIVRVVEDGLPNGDGRFNIIIQKDKITSVKYPRDYSEIKKKPL